ncbi:carbohydrate kinase family protein [Patescibacteria group bacterium]|nr:carbohydrate kinase family protein [Patescibacteria group bacterium]
MLDVITIGSVLEDTFLFLDPADAPVIDNPNPDPKREKLITLEFGAKIDVKDSFVTIGGGGMNTAVTFARSGLKCACFASLGRDDAGSRIEKALKKEKIGRQFIAKDSDQATGFSILIVTGKDKNDRVILIERGASNDLNFSSKIKSISKTKWYYLTALSGDYWDKELSDIFSVARKKQIKLAWNPGSSQLKAGISGLSKYMKDCEIFIVNRDEAIELVQAKNDIDYLLRGLLDKGPNRVIISHGIEGVYYADKNQTMHVKANKTIKAKEPTGAGDALGSGIAAALIKNPDDIKSALEYGIRNSESVVQEIGAQTGIIYA